MKKVILLGSISSLFLLAGCNQPAPVSRQYTVKFVNYDGNTLQETLVDEGKYPVYEGETPERTDITKPHQYVYIGWDKELEKVTHDVTYQATYDLVYLFGTYPQTVVTDAELTEQIKTHGTQDPIKSDYVDYAGKIYYEFETLTEYRADDGTLIHAGNKNYYEVQDIKWKILGDEANKFYTTYNLLDVGIYHSVTPEPSLYANNYFYSSQRAWMNDTSTNGFLGRAFTASEINDIKTTTVGNSSNSTLDDRNPYWCQNTSDKIFALSRQELRDPDLGFTNSDSITGSNRCAITTDFARANDAAVAYGNYGTYWTRSPSYAEFSSDEGTDVYNVLIDGYIAFNSVAYEGRCIRPALVHI